MSSTLPTSRSPALAAPAEPKPRGANRSTKVAGKLKVLPEQPQAAAPTPDKPAEAPVASQAPAEFESPGTAADSDEDEADDEEDIDDVEVRDIVQRYPYVLNQLFGEEVSFTIRYTSFLQVVLVVMPCV